MTTARTDTLATVAFSSALTSPSVKQASHHVRPVGVAMPETHQHMVANLGDENEAAVRGHVLAATIVGRHHVYPTRAHVACLSIHLDLDSPLVVGIGVADDPSNLSLGNRLAHVAN